MFDSIWVETGAIGSFCIKPSQWDTETLTKSNIPDTFKKAKGISAQVSIRDSHAEKDKLEDNFLALPNYLIRQTRTDLVPFNSTNLMMKWERNPIREVNLFFLTWSIPMTTRFWTFLFVPSCSINIVSSFTWNSSKICRSSRFKQNFVGVKAQLL